MLQNKIYYVSCENPVKQLFYGVFIICAGGRSAFRSEAGGADYIGVRAIGRTSLSRELNKMRAEGVLDFDAKTITLHG